MVFGTDLAENIQRLAGMIDDVEVVLFHTPTLHNIPGSSEIRRLRRIVEAEGITLTIHLPTSLEPGSASSKRRKKAIRLAEDICRKTEELEPKHYIVHIPVSPPTLVAVPGRYFTESRDHEWAKWGEYTLEFLHRIGRLVGEQDRLLVENIDYSPCFLERFWQESRCGFCLDLGHLVLGGERVVEQMQRYLDVTRVIHLHGVVGHEEHLSLKCMPRERVLRWLAVLDEYGFKGVVTLEVFDGPDLAESLALVRKAFRSAGGAALPG